MRKWAENAIIHPLNFETEGLPMDKKTVEEMEVLDVGGAEGAD